MNHQEQTNNRAQERIEYIATKIGIEHNISTAFFTYIRQIFEPCVVLSSFAIGCKYSTFESGTEFCRKDDNIVGKDYPNMSMQYTEIFEFVKNEKVEKVKSSKTLDIFLIFAQNIDCGYWFSKIASTRRF